MNAELLIDEIVAALDGEHVLDSAVGLEGLTEFEVRMDGLGGGNSGGC